MTSDALTLDDAVNRIPIIKLWHLLLVPVQGHITDHQLDQLSEGLLARIHETGATGIVIDVTGMWLIDSHTCALLSRIATSARLSPYPTRRSSRESPRGVDSVPV